MDDHRDIATPKRTQEILEQFGLSAKKSLGQNFLIDTNILHNIVKSAKVDNQTNVIEVGPGIGALTEQLARAAKKVVAFEIDDRLLPVLEETLAPYDNITVLHQDVLKADLDQVAAEHFSPDDPLVLVANLPYYITTPIIMHFLESSLKLDSMTVMMQKEVANRISAAPGTKAYGSLSIAIQYYMDAEVAFTVPKTVFRPMPNVDSAIIHLTRKDKPAVTVKDEAFFFAVVRASFVQRRKTLRNNLQTAFGKEEAVKDKLAAAFEKSGIDPSRRGETLSLEEFGRLADALIDERLRLNQAD
ncbi:16S rRNA (adenine(1518)-N(6)/adenine(1519)-N(6))-dimethyltransferase RsmA [Atopococcus tabaci]|uniref:16S rRNA (adenine(1518)-N(6)/adenine(1519)-N(6))- dimethyltransferase RsmA n=1 Tax=Atopococcus tabaci TaxID=269774 RepID=UPI0004146CFE|nr:16S rRNA (adenine(1518)-N(6)/adenine(1519)-N(6))-dimethyltransferase RsmA [Atopococcus tabaci]